MAILTGNALSDEELDKNFYNNPAEIDMNELGEDSKSMTLAFVAMIADKKGYS